MKPVPATPGQGLSERAREILNSSWLQEFGYCAPNSQVYPWMWLWDSCFHALIWAALGDRERAVREVSSVLDVQNADGCVPHMGYQKSPENAYALWRQPGRSFLTQPPMYAHVIAVLHRQGVEVAHLHERARRGLAFLVEQRRDVTGLVFIVHPWEGGTDDSPRWDAWAPDPFDRFRWGERKRRLLESVEITDAGSGRLNPAFYVAPAGFNALVAFNLRELHATTGEEWARRASDEIVAALEKRWLHDHGTWADRIDPPHSCASVRTLDALLGVLVTDDDDRAAAVFEQLMDPSAFGAPYGPAGVHRDEPAFQPDAYWRGAAWPQLTYLLFIAAHRRGAVDVAHSLRDRAIQAAIRSGFAEYVDPLTGRGLGAVPQGWAGLPCEMERLLPTGGS